MGFDSLRGIGSARRGNTGRGVCIMFGVCMPQLPLLTHSIAYCLLERAPLFLFPASILAHIPHVWPAATCPTCPPHAPTPHTCSKAEVMNLLESAGFSRANPYYVVQQGKVGVSWSCSNNGLRFGAAPIHDAQCTPCTHALHLPLSHPQNVDDAQCFHTLHLPPLIRRSWPCLP